MAKFIKLTHINNTALCIRPEDVKSFDGTDKGTSCVYYGNKAAFVTETPDEILALIKEAG